MVPPLVGRNGQFLLYRSGPVEVALSFEDQVNPKLIWSSTKTYDRPNTLSPVPETLALCGCWTPTIVVKAVFSDTIKSVTPRGF